MGTKIEKEEREEYKKIILDMLGEADTVIARRIGVSNQTIIRWKKELIAEGRTTEEAIREARRQKKEEAKKNDSKPDEVLERLKEGKNKTEIAKELKIDRSLVKKYEDMLIENGLITREEIQEAKAKRKEEDETKKQAEGVQEINEVLKDKVLRLLNLGIDSRRIYNSLNISSTTFEEIKKELITEGKITEKQIKANREKRAIQDKDKVLELLFKGYMNTEIAIHIPLADRGYVGRIVEKLKAEGRITDKQIEEARLERKEKNRRKIVLDGLREGLTYEEIAGIDESKRLITETVHRLKKQLVLEGAITEEEIRVAREKRKTAKRQENKYIPKPDDERIKKLSYLGFREEEIMFLIGMGNTYIATRKRLMEENGLISRKYIRIAVRNKVINAEKRRTHLTRVLDFNANLNVQTAQDQIDYEKAMMLLDQTNLENVELLRAIIPLSSELVTLGNVNFVSTYLTRNDMGEEALGFMDECIDTINYEKESMVRKLTEGKKEIEKHMQRQAKQRQADQEKFVEELLKTSKTPSTEGIGEEEEGHGEH